MSVNLSAIRERAEAATEGPWFWTTRKLAGGRKLITGLWSKQGALVVGQDKVNAERLDVYDANFIEHSREDVLALLDEVDRLNARLEFWWKQLDESSFNYICAAIAISRVKRACAEAEALHRKIWDEMDDYADIGQPKGPFPGNTQVSVEKILEALSGP